MSIPVSIDPLGTLGAEVLPPGYTPLDYALFDGNTAVDTEVKIATPCWFVVDFQATIQNPDNVILGWRYNSGGSRVGIGLISTFEPNAVYFGRGTTFPEHEIRFVASLNRTLAECKLSLDKSDYGFNGEALVSYNLATALSSELNLWLGAANLTGSFDLGFTGKVFGLLFKDETGKVIADIRPALHNGSPCFYDVVRRFELTVIQGTLKQ